MASGYPPYFLVELLVGPSSHAHTQDQLYNAILMENAMFLQNAVAVPAIMMSSQFTHSTTWNFNASASTLERHTRAAMHTWGQGGRGGCFRTGRLFCWMWEEAIL